MPGAANIQDRQGREPLFPKERREAEQAADQPSVNHQPALGHVDDRPDRIAQRHVRVLELGPVPHHVPQPCADNARDESPEGERQDHVGGNAPAPCPPDAQPRPGQHGDQQHGPIAANRQPKSRLRDARQEPVKDRAEDQQEGKVGERIGGEPLPADQPCEKQHAGDGPDRQKQSEAEYGIGANRLGM